MTKPARKQGSRHEPGAVATGVIFAEALTNVIAGYGVALLVQAAAYPQFGIVTTFGVDAAIAAIFTAASLVRSYLLRRLFESFTRRALPNQANHNART